MPNYKLKIYKSAFSRNTRDLWSNTHEFSLAEEMGSPAIPLAVTQFVEFETRLHSAAVQFMRATVSLDDPVNNGYQPEELRVIDVNAVGLRAQAGEQM